MFKKVCYAKSNILPALTSISVQQERSKRRDPKLQGKGRQDKDLSHWKETQICEFYCHLSTWREHLIIVIRLGRGHNLHHMYPIRNRVSTLLTARRWAYFKHGRGNCGQVTYNETPSTVLDPQHMLNKKMLYSVNTSLWISTNIQAFN